MQEITWLSTAEAAKHLGITPRTLYRFIDQGEIAAFRFGRVIRLKQTDVDVPDLPVDVTIGGGPWNAVASRPTDGDGDTGSWSNAQRISLPVGADVTLLDLHRVGGDDPGASTPPTTATPQPGPASQQAALIKAAWAYLAKLLTQAIAQSLR